MNKSEMKSSQKCVVLNVYCHKSKGDAKNAAKRDQTPGISKRVYLCEHCNKWHYEGSR